VPIAALRLGPSGLAELVRDPTHLWCYPGTGIVIARLRDNHLPDGSYDPGTNEQAFLSLPKLGSAFSPCAYCRLGPRQVGRRCGAWDLGLSGSYAAWMAKALSLLDAVWMPFVSERSLGGDQGKVADLFRPNEPRCGASWREHLDVGVIDGLAQPSARRRRHRTVECARKRGRTLGRRRVRCSR
jgi:hypothetical protein